MVVTVVTDKMTSVIRSDKSQMLKIKIKLNFKKFKIKKKFKFFLKRLKK